MKKTLFICLLISFIGFNSNAEDLLYKKRFFEIPYNKALDNCGNHFAIGEGAEFILKRRIDQSKDFRGKSLIIDEHKIFKSDKKITIFEYSDFYSPMFEKKFELYFTSKNFYVFLQEFEKFPDSNFYKNIIFFTIHRTKLFIDMGAIYIDSKETYEKFKEMEFEEFSEDRYEIGRSIASKFNRNIGDIVKDGSWASYTGLSGCELVEKEIEKPKI